MENYTEDKDLYMVYIMYTMAKWGFLHSVNTKVIGHSKIQEITNAKQTFGYLVKTQWLT